MKKEEARKTGIKARKNIPSSIRKDKETQIVKQMMELRENDGTSILIVTHNVGVAAYMSDRMIVMKQGKVVDQGRTKDVLKCPSGSYTKELLEAVPDMEGIRYV